MSALPKSRSRERERLHQLRRRDCPRSQSPRTFVRRIGVHWRCDFRLRHVFAGVRNRARCSILVIAESGRWSVGHCCIHRGDPSALSNRNWSSPILWAFARPFLSFVSASINNHSDSCVRRSRAGAEYSLALRGIFRSELCARARLLAIILALNEVLST